MNFLKSIFAQKSDEIKIKSKYGYVEIIPPEDAKKGICKTLEGNDTVDTNLIKRYFDVFEENILKDTILRDTHTGIKHEVKPSYGGNGGLEYDVIARSAEGSAELALAGGVVRDFSHNTTWLGLIIAPSNEKSMIDRIISKRNGIDRYFPFLYTEKKDISALVYLPFSQSKKHSLSKPEQIKMNDGRFEELLNILYDKFEKI